MRVYQHLDRLRDDDALRPWIAQTTRRAWIAQTTRRACIDRLRARRLEQPADEDALAPADVDETLSPLDDALSVHEALGGLPEHCREILDRFFARDESYRTIGAALDLPTGTIASRISRCLDRLRKRLVGDVEEAGTDVRPEVG